MFIYADVKLELILEKSLHYYVTWFFGLRFLTSGLCVTGISLCWYIGCKEISKSLFTKLNSYLTNIACEIIFFF